MLCTMCMHGINVKKMRTCQACGERCCPHTIWTRGPIAICHRCQSRERDLYDGVNAEPKEEV